MSEPINPFGLLDKIDEAAEVIADTSRISKTLTPTSSWNSS